jgi:hypothetical protein
MTYHLFSRAVVSARKPHRCIWCWQRIEQNEVYYRESSVYDGRHQSHAWHWDCHFDAMETYFRYGASDFTPGMERPVMLPFRSMEAA